MAENKSTPMMRQYNSFKQQYKDKILLFRMGDFYETFGEDAKIMSKVLNIALTTRDRNSDPTPLAGFPHHAIDQYLPKLVKAGYQVAVADQLEDPKLAKGIVRRGVTRVVTPGTLMDDKSDDRQNRYLVAISQLKNLLGIAVCDLSTGEFKVTETHNIRKFTTEISRINPSEILLSPKFEVGNFSNYALQPLDDYKFDVESAQNLLTQQFNVKSLASFGIQHNKAAIVAAGAIIHYLQVTQKTDISHIQSIKYYDLDQNMILDRSTIRNLDIIESSGEMGNKATLVSILDKTQTALGGRKIRNWILHPLIDSQKIQNRLDYVEIFFSNPKLLADIQDALKKVSDIERLTSRLGLNRANARDAKNLAQSLLVTLEIATSIEQQKELAPLAKEINNVKPELQEVIDLIDKSISDNPPIVITEGNIIKDGFNKQIDEIRHQTHDSKSWIEELETKERKRTGITSLKVRFNKVFGYYIEVTNTHKEKVPADYIRKQTLVNCERYITEDLKSKEEIVLNAEEKLAQLEYECFQDVRTKLLAFIKPTQKVADTIAEIDAYSALADIARLNSYVKPSIHPIGEQNRILKIKNGRHPIIEQTTSDEFVSNDVELDTKTNQLIILTGPNMSGKSTYIRQVALITLMAQIGSFVPASSVELSATDRIFTRVGASDDLSAGRSTFMVEMDEAANIVNNATNNSLIILDEVGRGTSTYDGVSIAWAIAEYIHEKIGARCLFATHYHELLKLPDELPKAQNYNVAVLENDEGIVFLRKIEKGGTDQSYGIYVAQMAGLPKDIIDRANEILSGFEQEDMFGIRSEPVKKKKEEVNKTDDKLVNNTTQLTFMDTSVTDNSPTIFNELKKLNTNSITPMDALKILEKWKKRLG